MKASALSNRYLIKIRVRTLGPSLDGIDWMIRDMSAPEQSSRDAFMRRMLLSSLVVGKF